MGQVHEAVVRNQWPLREGIRSLSTVVVGSVAAKALSLVMQGLVGRWIGPLEYGRVTLILALGNILHLPMTGGYGISFVKFGAGVKTEQEKYRILNSIGRICLLYFGSVGAFFLLTAGYSSALLRIEVRDIHFGVLAGAALATWILSKNVFQGFKAWKGYLLVEVGYAIILSAALFFFHYLQGWRDSGLVWSFFLSYFVSSLFASRRFLRALKEEPSPHLPSETFTYGHYALFNGVLGLILTNSDKLVVNLRLGPEEVGIYNAYYQATIGGTVMLGALVGNFLFPFFVEGDKRKFWHHLKGGIPLFSFGSFIVSMLAGRIFLFVYGYDFWIAYLVLFSFFASINALYVLFSFFAASFDNAGIKSVLLANIGALGIALLMSEFFVGRMGLLGVSISFLTALLCGFFFLVTRISLRVSAESYGQRAF